MCVCTYACICACHLLNQPTVFAYCSIWPLRHVRPTKSRNFRFRTISNRGHAVAQLVEALRYKPEGRGFDSRFHWRNSSGRTMALGLTQPLIEMSTRNVSLGMTTLPFPCAESLDIWVPQPPGTPRPVMGLLYLTISNSGIFWCPEMVCSNMSLKTHRKGRWRNTTAKDTLTRKARNERRIYKWRKLWERKTYSGGRRYKVVLIWPGLSN